METAGTHRRLERPGEKGSDQQDPGWEEQREAAPDAAEEIIRGAPFCWIRSTMYIGKGPTGNAGGGRVRGGRRRQGVFVPIGGIHAVGSHRRNLE